jgi:hypothetical protein
MDWLNDLLGIGASAASGGVFGLLGAIGGQVSKYFQEKQRQAWEEKKWDREERMIELQMKSRREETEQELAIVQQQGSWSGLKASYSAVTDQPSYKWVAAAKSLFRLFLTTLLWLMAGITFYLVVTAGKAYFNGAELKELVRYMVYTIFFSASTAGMWWFGDRALTPPQFKNR